MAASPVISDREEKFNIVIYTTIITSKTGKPKPSQRVEKTRAIATQN